MSAASMNRRKFLRTSIGAALAAGTASLASGRRVMGANEKCVVGVMGIRGRGLHLARELAGRPDAEVAYVCDVDSRLFGNAVKTLEKLQGAPPKTTTHFQDILDDKDVDVLFNATPDHWHALPTILACQAGKDVYVEKPASHNIWEGRKMVEATRNHKRIVQLGTQNRSAPYVQSAVEYVRSGKLGDVHLVRVLNMKNRTTIGRRKDEPAPKGVDYDTWLGPAPKRPFNPNRFHYAWHWFWDYSGGDIINDGVHQMDIARWLIGKKYPKSVVTTGGKFFFDDDQETPDTQNVLFEYDDMTMTFELTLWTPYMKKTPWNFRNRDDFPNWLFNATRIEVYGAKGLMMMGRHGGGWQVFGGDWKEAASQPGRRPLNHHLDNFFECVRSRKPPNADIEEGHLSTLLCHLGNISYRLGGRKLEFDAATETFVADDEANQYLKRTYREPWAIPLKV